jgi:hypothetical protein
MDSSNWIALAALVLATGVGIAHYRLQKTTSSAQNLIQERLAAIEEERRSEELASRTTALVICEKQKEMRSSGSNATWLVFRNDGQAVAHDVWFEREPLASIITGNEDARYPRLAPTQEWKILADPNMDDPERVTFRYGWTDDGGGHEEVFVYSVFT